MSRSWIFAGMAAMMAACGSSVSGKGHKKWPTLTGAAPLVIAHRGASGLLPEHTLEAYDLAISQGADVIEPDLVITKDGVLIARHDRFLSTTTDVADKPEFTLRRRANRDPGGDAREDWWVEDFTLAEIRTLRARQPFTGRSKEHDGLYAIPTFSDILGLAARRTRETGRTIGVYPETKHPAYFASVGLDFDAPLISAVESYTAGPVFIQSFEADILKRIRGRTSARLVQLVYEARPDDGPNIRLADIPAYADGVGASKTLIWDARGEATEFIRNAHALGLFAHIWTFRDDAPDPRIAGADGIAELMFAFEAGADGVFTDFPETAVAVRAALQVRKDVR